MAVPARADCLRKHEAHNTEGATAMDICFFVVLTATPIAAVFAIGLRSFALGAASLSLLGLLVTSLVTLIRRHRRSTPPRRISAQPEIAALLREGRWSKGHRPGHGNGPGSL
ncbi:hypothetical protein OG349_06880 [Streptomyces sp. NBC_01317]|uniref:hypothetical protein n=1 Tax=Streptomyces sp. NBC_01317 TaxID=2903822 RepID=UPI002E11D779|nr:hypothetical protein OG349_06880 [Streptomyces sp. NBC_01317]